MVLQQTLAQRLMKAVIILAAGNGTRMKSPTPKVLHTVAGKPMLQWVIDAINNLKLEQIIIVTSPLLKLEGLPENVDVVVQKIPRGTGEALQIAATKLKNNINKVLLVCADTPLLDADDLKNLANSKADLTISAMKIEDLTKSYGRLELNIDGNPLAIIETKYNEKVKANNIANAGAYAFKTKMLQELLPMLKPNQESGEIYATDLVELAVAQNYTTDLVFTKEENFLGVNTLVELNQAEKIMQARLKEKHMLNGVRFLLPETSYVNYDAEIGEATLIEPNVFIGAKVQIAAKVQIFSYSYLSDCTIYSKASVGPFAHLRGGAVIQEGASIGNFVEVKNSIIGKKAKAKHLSYIGDASVGEATNIGAGTITCNYNGFEKFKTQIGKNVMVGVNTTLVAPVYVGDGAYIAAGSVITEDVAPDSLAISRTQQQEKSAWASNFRARYVKKLS
jgi:bifunctional UDP-N-acetylglucosamine pyrophosphorylase / glucosamine-1-phosphate N-acetyltransferase